MKPNIFSVYDLLDKIINNLDIHDSINLIRCCKTTYMYTMNKHFYHVFIEKILSYFNSLNKIRQSIVLNTQEKKQTYIILNKIYNHFRFHRDTNLPDILIYLCDNSNFLNVEHVFDIIISNCYFFVNGNFTNPHNMLNASDLLYLLQFYKTPNIIIKYIYTPPEILQYCIKYKSTFSNTLATCEINDMIKYLLYKHFFRYSEYIEDILTNITCDLILSNNIDSLMYLFNYYKFYKYKLNYQRIINSCMKQQNDTIIDIVHSQMNKQITSNTQSLILISKEYIRSLMQSKYFKVLYKIIFLYLGDSINLNIYFNEILPFYDDSNLECRKLKEFFSIENKLRLYNFKILK